MISEPMTQARPWQFSRESNFAQSEVLKELGVSEGDFVRMRDEISEWVYWDAGIEKVDSSSANWQSRLHGLSGRLRLIAETYFTKRSVPKESILLRQWLYCQAVCAYICSRLDYDFDAGKKPIPVRNREAETDRVLSQPPGERKTMCVGFVLLARDLIRDGAQGLGIEATFVGSFGRSLGEPASSVSNHAFLGLKLHNGLMVGAELVTPRIKLKELKARCTAPRFDFAMPFTRVERELFLARNFGADETVEGQTNHGDKQNCFQLTSMSFETWKSTPTSDLAELDVLVTRAFDKRAKWLKVD